MKWWIYKVALGQPEASWILEESPVVQTYTMHIYTPDGATSYKLLYNIFKPLPTVDIFTQLKNQQLTHRSQRLGRDLPDLARVSLQEVVWVDPAVDLPPYPRRVFDNSWGALLFFERLKIEQFEPWQLGKIVFRNHNDRTVDAILPMKRWSYFFGGLLYGLLHCVSVGQGCSFPANAEG